MSEETFLNYHNGRWFWFALCVTLLAIILYTFGAPVTYPSGSTPYGYTLGIICGLFMVYLLWYGSRKKRYFATYTTLKEVLSAHVWIGIALLVLIPFHSGFRFHWNVHTMTFIFCVLTIVTGIWGTYLYRRLPAATSSNRGGGSLKQLLEQLHTLEGDIVKGAKEKSDSFKSFVNRFNSDSLHNPVELLFGKRTTELDHGVVARAARLLSDTEQKDALAAISLIDKKNDLVRKIERETLVQAWLKAWLYLHVPLACGAGVLLIIHIVSVLYYS